MPEIRPLVLEALLNPADPEYRDDELDSLKNACSYFPPEVYLRKLHAREAEKHSCYDRKSELCFAKKLYEKKAALAKIISEILTLVKIYRIGLMNTPRRSFTMIQRPKNISSDELAKFENSVKFFAKHLKSRSGITAKNLARLQKRFTRAQHSFEKARNKFVQANMRLVISIAQKYKHPRLTFLDFVQMGYIGLITAVERFDHTKGFRLSTPATWWIRQNLDRSIMNEGTIIRIPVHEHERIRKANRFLSPMPPYKKHRMYIVKRGKPRFLPFGQTINALRPHVSIDEEIPQREALFVRDVLPDETIPLPDALLHRKEQKLCIEKALQCLSPKERCIVKKRLGFNGHEPMLMEDIAKELSMPYHHVGKFWKSAIEKLRSPEIKNFLAETYYGTGTTYFKPPKIVNYIN